MLAGGIGSRLQSVVCEVPKVLAPIGQKPFLDYLLTWLEGNGIVKVVISTGYKADLIKINYGLKYGALDIGYSNEDSPLGTGGAIQVALTLCRGENVYVLNGDSFFDANLMNMHDDHVSCDADVTLSVKEMWDYDRYGTVVINNGDVSFREKRYTTRGFVNCGVYIVRRDVFLKFNMPNVFSFENDFLCKKELNINAIPFDANFIDIGIPEDYELAQSLIPQWFAL